MKHSPGTDVAQNDTLILEETKLLASIGAQDDAKQDLEAAIEASHTRIQKLIKDLQEAKLAASRARSELDDIAVQEASMLAQVDVVRAATSKVKSEIEQLQGPVKALQEELGMAKQELDSAKHELAKAENGRSQLLSNLEEVRREYRSTVAQESRLEAEIEMAQVTLQEARKRIAEIAERMSGLQNEFDEQTEATSKTQIELRGARLAEARHMACQASVSHSALVAPQPTRSQSRQTEGEDGRFPPSLPGKIDEQNQVGRVLQAKESDQRIDEIYELADAGHTIPQISQATQMPQGRIELVLTLRGLR